jgi:hypothetical protein
LLVQLWSTMVKFLDTVISRRNIFRCDSYSIFNIFAATLHIWRPFPPSATKAPYHGEGPSNKTDCSNYWGIPVSPTLYKILSNILLPRLIPYVDDIIGDHQCGFWRNRLTTDPSFCICQILEKKMGVQWDRTSAIHRLQGSLWFS